MLLTMSNNIVPNENCVNGDLAKGGSWCMGEIRGDGREDFTKLTFEG